MELQLTQDSPGLGDASPRPAALCLLASARALALSPLSFLSPSAYLCGKRGFRAGRRSTKEPVQRRALPRVTPNEEELKSARTAPAAKGDGVQHAQERRREEHPFPRRLTAKHVPGAARLCTRNPACTRGRHRFGRVANRYPAPKPEETGSRGARLTPGTENAHPRACRGGKPHSWHVPARSRGADDWRPGTSDPGDPPARPYKRSATWFAFNAGRKKVPIARSRSAILISPHQLYLRAAPTYR